MAKKVKTSEPEKPAKKKKAPRKCTYVGGQAVMEGVMMMGKTCMATAVRDPDGEIQIEARRLNKSKAAKIAGKIPFVRGVVNLVSSLVRGTGVLMRSASVYGDDGEEGGRIQKWFAEKLKLNLMDVISIISVCIGVFLAVGIFFLVPTYLVELLRSVAPHAFGKENYLGGLWAGLVSGAIKLVIFMAYLGLILILKDIRRLYMYHGAEHKTINTYELGKELTVENVRESSRIHDRCGTSFLFIVLIINIIINSVVMWAAKISSIESPALAFFARLGMEFLLLPVIAGVSYEVLKLLARFDNKFVDIFKFPGKLLQKYLTTREPDDEMIEVAIDAFNKVLEMDGDESVGESKFVTAGILSKMLAHTKKKFAEAEIDESDAEWIYSIVLDIKRSELARERTVKSDESKRIKEIVDKRLTGRPLWYIIGDTDFMNCKIKVDERVLIPRPETEILADVAIKSVENGNKVLDMCTGSGCVAISVAKACKGMGVHVTAADVSDAAIELAKENAALNNVNVNFLVSDLFSNVRGRFNVIVCNPPYIRSKDIKNLQKEVRNFEPRVALDGGADGLEFYRRLADEVKSYLLTDGMLILECGEGQALEILKIFRKRDYAMVIKDNFGVDRFVKIVF